MTTVPVLINGRCEHWVDALDRGLQYGDGLFETLLVGDGHPFFWSEHLARLAEGCRRLAIPMPNSEILRQEAHQLCRESSSGSGVLKILLTRGVGGRGYRSPAEVHPTRVISLHPLPPDLDSRRRQGIRVRLCQTPLGINPTLAGVKHCNRLEQVLAIQEWNDPDIQEGLMCDTDGYLVEGIMANLFWLKGKCAYTPKIDRCGVAGVVRAWVMGQLRQWNLEVHEVRVKPEVLLEADEVFATNSVMGIVPLVEWPCRQHLWPIGEITRRLQTAFWR